MKLPIKTYMLRYSAWLAFMFLCTSLFAQVPGLVDPLAGKNFAANQNLTESAIAEGEFAWRKDIQVSSLTKEEIFDHYVADVVFVAYPGYKALPPEALTDENKSQYENYYKKQGTLVSSPLNSNFAIQGEGFFMVKDQNAQILFTRNGQFAPNAEGILVNSEGHTLQPELKLDPQSEVFVDEKGQLLQAVSGETTPMILYQFELFTPIANSIIERSGSAFQFSQYSPVVLDYQHRVYHKMLELSTTQAGQTLIEMTRILFQLKNSEDKNNNNYDFRQYLVDFLLKEFAKSSGNAASLDNFGQLSATIASNLLFNKEQPMKETSPASNLSSDLAQPK